MKNLYFLTANLPICSYFDIDGERRCDVCKNSASCYGNTIHILFDELGCAQRWLRHYKDRSVSCRLYTPDELQAGSREFYREESGKVQKFIYNRQKASLEKLSEIAADEFRLPDKTARFAKNFVKLLRYGKENEQ